MKTKKEWSQDWEHFDWEQIKKNLHEVEKKRQMGEVVDKAEVGISLEEFTEYFEWLYSNAPKLYYRNLLFLLLVQTGFSADEAQSWINHPEELEKILREQLNESI